MNPTLRLLLERKSIRAYEERLVPDDMKAKILEAAFRAPTAGNMMLYSIIEVSDQKTKDTLVRTCDNQPFIAKAPLVLLFLADYQKWFDYFVLSGAEELCRARGTPMRKPEEGDLLLACCDALIAAHTAVIAAESLGLGSCYIGDIMENYETHQQLFDLPPYAFPIALVCFGYPTQQQRDRPHTTRFGPEFICFGGRYKRFSEIDLRRMFTELEEAFQKGGEKPPGVRNAGQERYSRKFGSDFAIEMSRSVRAMLRHWRSE
jgi:FMN reductase (NADPH)/FMN reductase [NAD(P)H]